MRFEFVTAGRIIFGAGSIRECGPAATAMGKKAILVTGRNRERASTLGKLLSEAGIAFEYFSFSGEPTTDLVTRGTAEARRATCDMVVAFGGGSVLDAGKAIAALATNSGDIHDYLEVIGKGQPLRMAPLPVIAIPTTAGTGAEVTRNAVLGSLQHKVKVSMRHPMMLPRVAIVDPELTYSLPPSMTATTGLDALTQLLEAFVSNQSNPMTDGLCREGMQRARRSLRQVFEDGKDTKAREDMSIASLFSGIALANARLGAVHGFAGVLGGNYAAPHGAICARLLPLVMEANIRALETSDLAGASLRRYEEAARLLTGNPNASSQEGVAWVKNLVADLNIPSLTAYGVREQDFPKLIQGAQAASSMKGNPVVLSEGNLRAILQASIA